MKRIAWLLLLFINSGLFSQKNNVSSSLYRCWAASYEENNEESKEKIYRPCEKGFPPSRFRQTINFNQNGSCKVLMVGETDLHYQVECKWNYDKKKKIISIADDKKKVKMKFKLVKVDDQILKIVFME